MPAGKRLLTAFAVLLVIGAGWCPCDTDDAPAKAPTDSARHAPGSQQGPKHDSDRDCCACLHEIGDGLPCGCFLPGPTVTVDASPAALVSTLGGLLHAPSADWCGPVPPPPKSLLALHLRI